MRERIQQLTIDDLHQQVDEFGSKSPQLKEDERFVAWFLRAFLTEDDDVAFKALCGTTGDQGVDAVLIDDAARAVFVVQGKYRKALSSKSESRSDVLAFSQLAHDLSEPSRARFRKRFQGGDPYVADLLARAHIRTVERKYRLALYYATTGKCSAALQREAARIVKNAPTDDATIEILDGSRIMAIVRDYLDGVAPPIASLDLEMEKGKGIDVNGIHQRYDHHSKIESWVFSMRGSALASVLAATGPRLFARNIRGFLGESTAVNKSMQETLDKEPKFFFYYNNGITVLCDHAEKRSSAGKDILRIGNPQIINGQQTTRVLGSRDTESSDASVLVKVIRVPRTDGKRPGDFDRLLARMVKGTNWQNEIKPSDLIANDRQQIDIERAFRKLGYLYIRKRQTKREARRQSGLHGRFMIKKDDLAKAVAGCDLDPVVVRSGKERLFEAPLYDSVFPNADPNFYLPRYWLMREATYASRGTPNWGYMKWMVLGFVWRSIEPALRSQRGARAFRMLCESQADGIGSLNWAIVEIFREVTKFYNKKKGRGEQAIDVSQFFRNRRGLDREFRKFFARPRNQAKRRFESYLDQAISALDNI